MSRVGDDPREAARVAARIADRESEKKSAADELAPFGLRVAPPLPDLIAGSDFLEVNDPPLSHAIRPIVPRSEVTEINGGHGRFKSTLALDMALSIATGRRWGPYEVVKGAVAFISMEDREPIIRRRIFGWLGGIPEGERPAAIKDIGRNFYVLGREHARDYAMTRVVHGRSEPIPDVIAHMKKLAAGKVAMFVETSARLHRGDEDNEGLSIFAMALEEIATDSGASIVVVRHQSKNDARAQSTDSYSGRGGGALSDACRSILVVSRSNDEGPITITHAKYSYGPREPATHWVPQPHTFNDGSPGVYLRMLERGAVVADLRDRVFNAIVAKTDITNRDLMKAFRNERTSAVSDVIKTLLDEGKIVESIVRGRGKPSKRYRATESREEVGT